MASPKKTFKTVDEYIATFPKETQIILEHVRKAVKDAAPQAKETISYQMPAYRLNGILVWFAAFKNHIGFFPKVSAMEVFKKDLTKYEVSKGTIRFPLDEPIPIALIKKIVKYRVTEDTEKEKLKKLDPAKHLYKTSNLE
jgi:uncharacterized protein YdhG (YjbR/CyaY superfamily)